MGLKNILKNKIPKELLNKIPSSFDIVGSRSGAVAIIEIPEELDTYKHIIAEAIVKLNRHVKTVLRRVGPRTGPFRLYRYEVLIQGPTEVLHKEHGYYLKLDPTKVYFSPRDQNDRIQIAKMVRENETIMYMFAGIGPYAVAICKFCPNVRLVVAIELNPTAHEYMISNVRINKLKGRVIPILGDVRKVCPKFYEKFDRVLMTLPLGAFEYLDLGIKCLRREGGYLHFYHLGSERDPFSEAERLVLDYCEKFERECKIINKVIVRDYAPRVYKVRLDVYVKG